MVELLVIVLICMLVACLTSVIVSYVVALFKVQSLQEELSSQYSDFLKRAERITIDTIKKVRKEKATK